MRRVTFLSFAAACLLSACGDSPPDKKDIQADKAEAAANSLNFAANAEIDNIQWRLRLTSNPGQIGYILLLNEAGQPILYETVVGKITSGSKRLTKPYRVSGTYLVEAPSDEGTYGSSNPYVYWKNTSGAYRQWSGTYFYSDQPIRLRIEPLAISVAPPAPAKK